MHRLSPFTQRFVAWSLLAVLLLSVLTCVVLPLLQWTSDSIDELGAVRERRARLEAIARGAGPRTVPDLDADAYLEAPSADKAQAALETRVRALAAAQGITDIALGRLESANPAMIALSISASGKPGALIDLGSQIEKGPPGARLRSWKLSSDDAGAVGHLDAVVLLAWGTLS